MPHLGCTILIQSGFLGLTISITNAVRTTGSCIEGPLGLHTSSEEGYLGLCSSGEERHVKHSLTGCTTLLQSGVYDAAALLQWPLWLRLQ